MRQKNIRKQKLQKKIENNQFFFDFFLVFWTFFLKKYFNLFILLWLSNMPKIFKLIYLATTKTNDSPRQKKTTLIWKKN